MYGRETILNLDAIRYIIGIDLGTTNTAVSYVDLEEGGGRGKSYAKGIRIFKVPQLTGAGEVNRLSVLPSFLYIPGEYDISENSVFQPWNPTQKNFAGAFARDHGSKVPSRLVSSAKSWLCHDKADRRAKILPWGARTDMGKVSPVDATCAYLEHIKKTWNAGRGNNEDLYLENQFVVITVPASFDEVARDLTVEAAKMAGLKKVTLLEEPLAAFYSWLIKHEKDWARHVNPGELILVCDIGGGTTDFTLITLRETQGTSRFERIAVGDHLILGGDNIDLALALSVEKTFDKNRPALSGDRWKELCHQCRRAKENILSGKTDVEHIAMRGEGRSLIKGTVSAKLTREMLEETVLEGFFPDVDIETVKKADTRKGISEFGLPYEQEPAMTKHLGWFLENHKADIEQLLNKNHAPDHIFFNGGSLKPKVITEKIRKAVRYWFKEEDETLPRVLENPDPDLSVALGASYYGLAKIGKGVRVGSGSPRAYYLGISVLENGKQTSAKAVCLVERGLDEGTDIRLEGKKMTVLANRPVSFEVFSSSYRSGDKCCDVVDVDETLTTLPSIQTIIKFGKKGEAAEIPVQVEAQYTEIGTLVLWCRSLASDHRWQLQFQLRSGNGADAVEVVEAEVYEEKLVQAALGVIRTAFSKENKQDGTGIPLVSVPKTISKMTGTSKAKWPLSFVRAIADQMLENIEARKISAQFEHRWLNLTGYAVRPGFGQSFDEERVKKIWKIFKQGPVFNKSAQVKSEWWILWRRVAAGLTAGQQRQFVQELSSLISHKKTSAPKISPQERLEIWMAVANMERLLVKDKVKWGNQLLSEMIAKKSVDQHFWSLSRIGARELLYGSVDRVIPPSKVEPWIEKLLSFKQQNPKPVAAALVQLARKTGDRMRDINPETIDRIQEWMTNQNISDAMTKPLHHVVCLSKKEENTIFGEALPSGIVLHG
ncbi:Hsp70 family protein [Desulfobacula toluolica]|uniref:Hsp70 family protein n=1 Tax=Desulfobacula toluolica TaxID=28223 RepID=UPI0006857D5C|nr:Hsp70 family protein [Desulfobacula toluolica]